MRTRIVALAFALGVALFASANAAEAATPIQVVHAAVPDYAALYIAKEKGLFEQHGLDVTLQVVGNSAVIPPALVSHSAQIAGIPDAVFMQAAAGGLDLVMFAGVGWTPKEIRNGSIVVRTGLDLHKPADLAGHKVGISGIGSFFQILFLEWLERQHVDAKKIQFVETPFLQMGDLLKSGNVDAVAVGQPFVNRIVSAGVGYEMAPYISELGEDIPIGGFAAERGWARDHASEVASFRAALHEAVAMAAADPKLVDAVIIKYLKMAPETLKNIPLNRLDDRIDAGQLDFWQRLMSHQGLITQKIDATTLIVQ